jgi:uncharacterized protein YggE
MKQILFVVILGLSHVLSAAEPELRGTVTEVRQHLAASERMVVVSGEGEAKSPADRAIVTLRLISVSKSLQEALKANQTLRSKLINTLKERGIPADRIDAGKFSSTPRHGVFSDKVKSYRVENQVKVAVSEEKELQETVRMLDELEGLEYGGMEFEHSRKQELKRKALAEALEAASARKKVYEERLALTLTPVKFSENVTAAPSRMESARAPYFPGISGVSSPDFREPEQVTGFGEMVFTAQVTVQYSVSGR